MEAKDKWALAEEKLLKAKIKLQSRSPFFSYLSYYLKFQRAKEQDISPSYSISVDVNGNIYFNPDFILKQTDEEVIGLICHEIFHLAFFHLIRRGCRKMPKWNIVTDLATNSMLIKNNFSLPKCGLIPNYNNSFEFPSQMFGKKIRVDEINTKTAEELYEELPELKEQEGEQEGGYIFGFDEHKEGQGNSEGSGGNKGQKSRPLTNAEIQELEEKWKERIEEALMNSKARGNIPAGMERFFEKLRKSYVPWRTLVERIISKSVPRDMTWLKRSKKSIACGVYLPSILKEVVDIVVTIDTSGSIGQAELTAFISEIVGLARAFQSHINMRLITHDTGVQNDYEIKNGNIAKIQALKIKGGGGTSHKEVFDYIKEKYKNMKLVISFTDGFSDLSYLDFGDYKFEKVFILDKNGSDEQIKDKKCKIIKMRE